MPCPAIPLCLHLSAPGCPQICLTCSSCSIKPSCLLPVDFKANSIGGRKGSGKKDTFVTCGVSLGRKELTPGRLKVVAGLHKAEYCCSLLQGGEGVQYGGVCQTLAALWTVMALSCTLLIAVANDPLKAERTG